jgi:carbonic anhydrase
MEEVKERLPGKPDTVRQKALEQAMTLKSLGNLLTFPWIGEEVKSGRITLHGWYFDMASGILEVYDAGEHKFSNILDVPADLPGPRSSEELDTGKLLDNI